MPIIHKIIEGNAYLNGNTQAGRIAELKFPTLEFDKQEFDALGLQATLSLPGKLKEMDGEVTWNSIYPDAESQIFNPFGAVALQVRHNLRRYNSGQLIDESEVVTFLTAQFYSNELGSTNMKDALKRPAKCIIHSVRQVIGGKELICVDAWNNIFRVNGVDYFAKMRQNIGV